ncbi:MAG: alpha amylase C-terminal domain-containing protein [Leptospiraceae bacterium]|nr:alpha amylase C-terminal domain-containing protein [Leptospiraceae bacterium]
MNSIAYIKKDPYLEPFVDTIMGRMQKSKNKIAEFTGNTGSLSNVCNGYKFFGLHKTSNSWIFREWAPNATKIYLVSKSSNWQIEESFSLHSIGYGKWEIELPLDTFVHEDLYYLHICWNGGEGRRIPSYATRVTQDPFLHIFNAQVWDPPQPYVWKNSNPPKRKSPLIYEAHVGMSSQEGKIETYSGFRQNVLPRIARANYDTIQLMAIMEHPYYGSFGYHVSNYYAPASRCGTPDELKELIDEAHGYGISVIMDIVHSHSVKNEVEGLSHFDGSPYQYFHDGPKGYHKAWDSRCFDYGKNDVVHFLLSNCKFWLEEYRFDGFRFDGVTSMIYLDHGLGTDFTSYNQYYNLNQDEDALTYLSLANHLIHEVSPYAISVAEEMSAYPGLCIPLEEGGIGFDFRLAMGTPDYWITLLKTLRFENWHMGNMFYRLSDKRVEEKTISYCESHDQAIVGDKTISFRLMDAEMYSHMDISQPNLIVENGIAMHKLIRLVTLSCAPNGYLNFMGNEFGHPEWIDFPREGNGWSYHYARRQWNLADDTNLKYHYLNNFDHDMIGIFRKYQLLESESLISINQHDGDQVLIFSRGGLYFVFNFNPYKSFTEYGFEAEKGQYKIILNSDSKRYHGHDRVDDRIVFSTVTHNSDPSKNYLNLYIPTISAFVLEKV